MNYSLENGFVFRNTERCEFFQSMKNFVDFFWFLVRAFKTSEFESLLDEGIFNDIRKPSRLSNPCFAVLIPNLSLKPVFKLAWINLDYFYSFSLFSSVSVDFFWLRQNSFHLTTFWIFSLQWVCHLEEIFGMVLGQSDSRFNCRRVGTPCGDFPYWKREQGPGPSKKTTLVHS